ncbi:MAG: TIGR00730 family Rossman fold protein [Candidatus Pacebacteria bacterium]|nr:TIGR00730 family Rossman fold protein [Candidatus Paceibacterota bacterium]
MDERQIKLDEVQSLARIFQEFKNGFDFLKKYPKTVSIFGSARFSQDDQHCKDAELLATRIVSELGYAVMTGGGPGIMLAANKGAHDAGGLSLGVTIRLPKEQKTNTYVVEDFECTFFFTRRTLLSFAAEAYIAFPGGYGTLDELFERLTLIQNDKIPRVPIILVGTDFWNPLVKYLKEVVYEGHDAITKQDLDIFTVTDNLDEVIDIIKKAPVSRWWRHIEQ